MVRAGCGTAGKVLFQKVRVVRINSLEVLRRALELERAHNLFAGRH